MDTVEKQIRWEAEQGEQLRLLTNKELREFEEALTNKAREILELDILTEEERKIREVE